MRLRRTSSDREAEETRPLRNPVNSRYVLAVSAVSINAIKQREGEVRQAGLNRARRTPAEARVQQRRASLVGTGRDWKLTNLASAARVMTTWR